MTTNPHRISTTTCVARLPVADNVIGGEYGVGAWNLVAGGIDGRPTVVARRDGWAMHYRLG